MSCGREGAARVGGGAAIRRTWVNFSHPDSRSYRYILHTMPSLLDCELLPNPNRPLVSARLNIGKPAVCVRAMTQQASDALASKGVDFCYRHRSKEGEVMDRRVFLESCVATSARRVRMFPSIFWLRPCIALSMLMAALVVAGPAHGPGRSSSSTTQDGSGFAQASDEALVAGVDPTYFSRAVGLALRARKTAPADTPATLETVIRVAVVRPAAMWAVAVTLVVVRDWYGTSIG